MPKKCEHLGCTTRASYGTDWMKPTHCLTHKADGMKDVVHKQCEDTVCTTRANYGTDWMKPTHCLTHKADDMKDVVHKQCEDPACETQAAYGKEWRKPTHCVTHKADDMKDVVSKQCENPGCRNQPSYGEEWKKPTHCLSHKADDMKDVINKRCEDLACTNRPSYGTDWNKPTHCLTHKTDYMKNVVSKRCEKPECETHATYGKEWNKPTHCLSHRADGMKDVVHKSCISEWCETRCNEKYKGHCLRCFCYLFPNEPVSRQYKTKETEVVKYIKETFSSIDWVIDKAIQGGCSKRRPDLLADLGKFIIIIEIDENEHEGYSCENRRIMEISQDLEHRPVIFIRFNPDKYDGVSSCWGVSKNGTCAIKKGKVTEWKNRLQKLSLTIQEYIDKECLDKPVINIEHLFYSS